MDPTPHAQAQTPAHPLTAPDDVVRVSPPGLPFQPPQHDADANAPVIFAATGDAGPDQTLLLVGEGLDGTAEGWGESDGASGGQLWPLQVQFATGQYQAVTIPQVAYDGIFVVWARDGNGLRSRPLVLNAPEAWWATPDTCAPGDTIEIYGRNLARRPDFDRAHVYAQPTDGGEGAWLQVTGCDKYRIAAVLPAGSHADTREYRLWVHTGKGGALGWSNPLRVRVVPPTAPGVLTVSELTESALRDAVASAARQAPAVVQLPPGRIALKRTLAIPAGVTIRGAGADRTQFAFDGADTDAYALATPDAWQAGPSGPGNRPDQLHFHPDVPKGGVRTVWVQYALGGPLGQKAISRLKSGRDEPVDLAPLPHTGGWGRFRWGRAGSIELKEGAHPMVWEEPEGTGVIVRALVLASDPDDDPSDETDPSPAPGRIVLQGENVTRHVLAHGDVPGAPRVAVHLEGDGASLEAVAVEGSPRIDTGVLFQHGQFPRWLRGARLVGVRVTGIEGKRMENRAVHLRYAHGAQVRGCELWGRVPVYLAGVRQCHVRDNRLVPQRRFGGGAEGTILGRQNIIEQCVIADNVVAAPPARSEGSAGNRRMIWLSTGHGSVSNNCIARNRTERARFMGLPGTDQNVGETLLLEACQEYAFLGHPADVGAASVTLPASVPPTPEANLGSTLRHSLPTDSEGRETPLLPPPASESDGVFQTPTEQYYVVVLEGEGFGQTRRVVAREGHVLHLDRPWRVEPDPDSRILVTTLFYRNLILANDLRNGMSGVQLWFTCIENVVAGNTVADQRRGGISLHASRATLASSQRRTWNRGVGPSYFNTFEDNSVEGTTDGGIVSAGGDPKLPAGFPLILGTVMRQNTFHDLRGHGFLAKGSGGGEGPREIVGTLVECNMVRSPAHAAFTVEPGADLLVFRRNHALFWQPPLEEEHTVFEFHRPGTYVQEHNATEQSDAGRSRIRMVREGKKETGKR